mgnify:CR=1 FL=1
MLHIWAVAKWDPGSKEKICRVCGAKKVCYTIGMKITPKWSPAMLEEKRQPLCPGYKIEL